MYGYSVEPYLKHHGILGQKWGIRRYQNRDGTLTEEGRIRYGYSDKGQRQFSESIKEGSLKGNTDYKRTPQYKTAVRDLQELGTEYRIASDNARVKMDELERYFYQTPEIYDKYLNRAIDRDIETYGSELSREELERNYRYGDFDQGDLIEMYVQDGGSDNDIYRDFAKAEDEQFKILEKLNSKAKTYAKEFLGSYGDEVVTRQSGWKTDLNTIAQSSFVNDVIFNPHNRKNKLKLSIKDCLPTKDDWKNTSWIYVITNVLLHQRLRSYIR